MTIRLGGSVPHSSDDPIEMVRAFGSNMMDRDDDKHKKNLKEMCIRLALADEVGALVACVTKTIMCPTAYLPMK